MADVPDGMVDPDTGHCRAAMDGDCAPAAAVSFLFAAGITVSEKHLHFAMDSGPDGTEAWEITAALRAELAASAAGSTAEKSWDLRLTGLFAQAVLAARALLVGFVQPENGARHLVCVVPDHSGAAAGGVWVHDPAWDERVHASWDAVAAYRPDLVIGLFPASGMAKDGT